MPYSMDYADQARFGLNEPDDPVYPPRQDDERPVACPHCGSTSAAAFSHDDDCPEYWDDRDLPF